MYKSSESIFNQLLDSLDSGYHDIYFAFDKEHPEVFNMFMNKSLKVVGEGKTKYSARRIIQEIRWDEDTHFHMPDPVIAYYARRFISLYPQHRHFFNLRGLSRNIDEICVA